MKARKQTQGQPKHVTALFADRELSFDLPEEATLADLADCLASTDEVMTAPVSVCVRFDA